jgi:hypothetical protein
MFEIFVRPLRGMKIFLKFKNRRRNRRPTFDYIWANLAGLVNYIHTNTEFAIG